MSSRQRPSPRFASERLVYRAARKDDAELMCAFADDAASMVLSRGGFVTPIGEAEVDRYKKLTESMMVCLIICLPKSHQEESVETAGVPVGWMCLDAIQPHQAQNRTTSFAIELGRQHRGQGYGSEALNYLLEQAFVRYNLHKVECGAFSFNPAALTMYQKIGMTVEGTQRSNRWAEGQYHDTISLGILDSEWHALHPVS